VLLIRLPAPRSYTGEESFEVLMPGNPNLVGRVVELLTANPGVRPAGPGEFSARALLNDRLTLDRAEGVLALITARREDELRAARRLSEGEAGERYRDWSGRIANLLALVEAGIDFTDQEDVVPITPAELSMRLRTLADELETYAGGAAGREARRDLPRVVLAGEPNAGKSTLFNALLGRRRVVSSPEAGTTRDVIEETWLPAGPGGPEVILCDLPGLDESAGGACDVERANRAAQQAARAAIERADLVVWCDPSGRFESATGRAVRVRTKADQPGPASADLSVCALDGWNLEALRRAIADSVDAAAPSALSAVAPRHARALAQASSCLRRAESLVGEGLVPASPELVAAELRRALDAFDDLAGRVSPDQVLGRVFAAFCVGK
jgi:tRNA modification GTPase